MNPNNLQGPAGGAVDAETRASKSTGASQPTPGPWEYASCAFAHGDPDAQVPDCCEFWITGGPADEVIALTSGPLLRGSQEGNARLFAAAPDLLEAGKQLKAATAALVMSIVMGQPLGDIDKRVNSATDAMNAAITKAEGR